MNSRLSDHNFLKGPTRIIIIDISPSTNTTTLTNLSDSLQNFVSLASNIKISPPRIHAMALWVMASSCDCLFPLQTLKGNLQRFYSAVSSLKDFATKNKITLNIPGCIRDTLLNVLHQEQNFEQDVSRVERFEVVLFTTRSLNGFASEVGCVLTSLDLENVGKIQVVGIVDVCDSGDEGNKSQAVAGSQLSGVVKVEIKSDRFQFDNFFKNWLHNRDVDHENVHIILPGYNETDGGEMLVKCDIFERIVNPELLPTPEQFLLHADPLQQRQKTSSLSKPKENAEHIYRLVAVRLVKQSGICDSILYGMPHILIATGCWKIEWTELESNQQAFVALCQLLNSKNAVLICKLKSPLPNSVSGHFVVFPSPQSSSLLIKSIAVDEILLPSVEMTSSVEIVKREMQEKVDKHLACLNTVDVYRVTDYSAALFRALSSGFSKGKVMVKPQLEKEQGHKPLFKGSRAATKRNLAERLNL